MPFTIRVGAVVLLAIVLGCDDRASEPTVPSFPVKEIDSAGGDPTSHAAVVEMPPITLDAPSTDNLATWASGGNVAYRYRFSIEGKSLLTLPDGQVHKLDSNVEYKYTWVRRAGEADLLLHLLQLEMQSNGQPMMKSSVSRSRFYLDQGGQSIDETYETGNERVKEMLRSGFDRPLYRITVDQQGKETSRTQLVHGPVTQMLTDNGVACNAGLFHPPFHGDKSEWTALRQVSQGTGNVAEGTLTYRVVERSAGSTRVRVSGSLAGTIESPTGGITNTAFEVRGVQVHDKRLRAWTAGKLLFDMSMTAREQGQEFPAKGTMAVEMRLLTTEEVSNTAS